MSSGTGGLGSNKMGEPEVTAMQIQKLRDRSEALDLLSMRQEEFCFKKDVTNYAAFIARCGRGKAFPGSHTPAWERVGCAML